MSGGGGGMHPGSARFIIPAAPVEASPEGEEGVGKKQVHGLLMFGIPSCYTGLGAYLHCGL